jgi:type VI protein secretion system component VasF
MNADEEVFKHMNKPQSAAQPIMENEYVNKLMDILEANKLPEASPILNLVAYVGEMERQLGIAVNELKTVREEIALMREENHPVVNKLQKAASTLQAHVHDLRDKISAFKHDIVAGCKAALAAFEEKGLSALRDVVEKIKLRPALEAIRRKVDRGIREDKAAIATIETISAEYHKAGRAVKNIARAVIGIEAIQEAKPVGKVAKALTAPARAELACVEAIGRCVDKAIGAVKRLETIERKEPIKDTMDRLSKQIEQARRDTPERGRQRLEPVHADR